MAAALAVIRAAGLRLRDSTRLGSVPHKPGVGSAAFSPDGTHVVTASAAKMVAGAKAWKQPHTEV